MTPNEILEIDAKRNHPPGTVAGHLRAEINDEIKQGGELLQDGKTLILYRPANVESVEYFIFNAGTLNDFFNANEKILNLLKKTGAKFAETEFIDPNIGSLFEQAKNVQGISILKEGDVYIAKVRL